MIKLKVSELMNYIKGLTSKDYVLSKLVVEGEISNLNFHSNGIAYFTIKDEFSGLECIYQNFNRKPNINQFENGNQVGVTGKITLYEKSGRLSMIVEDMEKIGLGAIYEKFLFLKRELEKEGYFDPKYKRPIPPFPKKIGLITSETGAAVRDIISVIKRRNRFTSLYLYPAVVQGPYSKDSLIKGLDYFEDSDMDLIIIGRGGGSYEDLDSFNDRELALKIFHFPIPIISAVGHEIDFVISDFVSDIRAATPSVAGELAVKDFNTYLKTIESTMENIFRLMKSSIEIQDSSLLLLNRRLNSLSIDKVIEYRNNKCRESINYFSKFIEKELILYREKLNSIGKRISSELLLNKVIKTENDSNKIFDLIVDILNLRIYELTNQLHNIKHRLDKLDVQAMFDSGYSLIYDKNGKLVKRVRDIMINDTLDILLSDGRLQVTVNNKETNK